MSPARSSHPNQHYRTRHGAFTLIELLTVIAIIGILAGILIPIVSRVRESAKNTQCISNMRQIGVAARLFMNDNKGIAPPSQYNMTHLTWTYLEPYIGKKAAGTRYRLRCPNLEKVHPDPKVNGFRTCYSWNGNFSPADNSQKLFRRVTDDYPESRVVAMYDDPQPTSDAGGKPADNSRGSLMRFAFWHGNKCNLLMLDGHVVQVAIGPDGIANSNLGSSKDYPQFFWGLSKYPKVPGWAP